jgi:carbamoyltransferase
MERHRTYVGLSTSFRRSSVAIVSSSGELQFAHGGERILERNDGPAYSEALAKLVEKYCSSETEIILALAANEQSPDPRAMRRKLLSGCAGESKIADVQDKCLHIPVARRAAAVASTLAQRYSSQLLSQVQTVFEYELERLRGWSEGILKTRCYPIHLSHAAAACLTGPYSEALCAVVDGSDGQSCRCYAYRGGELFEITPARRPRHEGSLSALYRDVSNACGFQGALGEHWKVVALAPYGTFDPEIYRFLQTYVSADGLSLKAVDQTEMMGIYNKLDGVSRRPGEPVLSAANLACTAQVIFEETLCGLLRNISATGVSQNLVFTGSCALNPSANGSILERTHFKSLHIPPAPDAEGSAIGAALLAYQDDEHVVSPRARFQTPYLGFEVQSIEFETAAKLLLNSCKITHCEDCTSLRAARPIAAGQIIGWINGRAEFGSQALGNRSVLADPRREGFSDFIETNSAEAIRHFGVAILHEYGAEYFDGYQTSPYGERALKFRLKAARKIPFAVQGNGRVQVQSIKRDWNEGLYDLIFAFYSMTGIPLVINMNYGITDRRLPETLEDIYVTFSTSRLDALFVGNLQITRQ